MLTDWVGCIVHICTRYLKTVYFKTPNHKVGFQIIMIRETTNKITGYKIHFWIRFVVLNKLDVLHIQKHI